MNIIKTNYKRGFTIAEALITLMIVSLILSAVVPVVTRKQATSDAVWRYVKQGTGSQSNAYFGLGWSQAAIIGHDKIPPHDAGDANIPYGSRLIITTHPRPSGYPVTADDTIKRSIIDFEQRTSASATTYTQIGRLSFDQGNNIALGKAALSLNAANNTEGINNIAVGFDALRANGAGSSNVSIGSSTLKSNTTGSDNVALGQAALFTNTTGARNIAIGSGALFATATTSDNTAVGFATLANATNSTSNTAVGSYALSNSTPGANNTAVGVEALRKNVGGASNTALGQRALFNLTSGSNNVGIGPSSCLNVTAGTNNICIGSGVTPAANASNQLFIEGNTATYNGTTSLIYGNFTAGSRAVTLNGATSVVGNLAVTGNITAPTINGSVFPSSDKRLKNILGDSNAGIEKLNQIHIVNYVLKQDKTKRHRVGVIAQELQKIFPNSVMKMPNGYLAINTDEMFYAMLNSVRDMYKQIQTVIAKISGLEAKILELEKENAQLKSQLVTINERLDKLEQKKHK